MEEKIHTGLLRRLKTNAHVRSLVAPIRFSHQSFILPLFITEGISDKRPILNMESVSVHSTLSILQAIETALKNGISKFLLFPIPANKKDIPDDFSFATKVASDLKRNFGDSIWLASDICLCSYTSHGHCGIMNETKSKVLNDPSIKILAEYSLQMAQAGTDCISPSDMMDRRIDSIRKKLDHHHLDDIIIMAYSAKFSSQWYGPFRDACHSTPSGSTLKDRKSYQLSPFNKQDAFNAALRDAHEGADILMVKPAGLYTDVLSTIKQQINKPLAAYHVSGEYASIEILAEKGMLDRAKAHMEVWAALNRSGADIIISYAAQNAKKWIEEYEY